MEYHPCTSKAAYLALFEAASADPTADFVEGLVYSHESAVVMVSPPPPRAPSCVSSRYRECYATQRRGFRQVGSMTDEEECTAGAAAGDATNRIGRWHKPWWYTHVQSFLSADGGYHSTAGSYRDGTQPVEFIPLRDWYHRHTKVRPPERCRAPCRVHAGVYAGVRRRRFSGS